MKDPRSFAPSSFSLSCVAAAGLAALVSVGCMGPAEDDPASGSGGAKGSGGAVGSGGATVPAGSGGASVPAGSGGTVGSGGATGSGGASSMGSGGANTGSGGRAGMGGGAGRQGSGGSAGGGGGRGGAPGSGGTMGGSAGAGGGSGTAPMASAGCGKAAGQTLNSWVASNVMSGTSSRPYSVRLPTGYDPMRAYPVIVLLHGCGGGDNNVPMDRSAGSDAILVRGTGSASGTCWDTNATGPDVTFFDAMVADTKARFCTDTKRVFIVGYSSGSWLVNQLTCIRSTVVRGAGTVAGGESARGNCTGPVSHMFFHDMGDTSNRIADSERARDRLLTQNGCDKAATPMAQQPSPCVRYQCPSGYPVVWCPTTGQNHNRQDNVVPGALWTFFKEF